MGEVLRYPLNINTTQRSTPGETIPEPTDPTRALEEQISYMIAHENEYQDIDEVVASIPKGEAEMKPFSATERIGGIRHDGVICNPDYPGEPVLFTPGLGSSHATTIGEKAILAVSNVLHRPVINFRLLGYGAEWLETPPDWWKNPYQRIGRQAVSQMRVTMDLLERQGHSQVITAGNCAGGVIALYQAAGAGEQTSLVYTEKTPGIGSRMFEHSPKRTLPEVRRCFISRGQAAEEKPSEISDLKNWPVTRKYFESMVVVNNWPAIDRLHDETVWGNVVVAGDGFTNPAAHTAAVAEREQRLQGKNYNAVVPQGTHLKSHDYAMFARILGLHIDHSSPATELRAA